MHLALAAAVALRTASCAWPTPPPSGSESSRSDAIATLNPTGATTMAVVVRQQALAGNGFYAEGDYAFVEIRPLDDRRDNLGEPAPLESRP